MRPVAVKNRAMDETKNLSENEGTKPPTEGSGGPANRRSGQNQVHQLTSFNSEPLACDRGVR